MLNMLLDTASTTTNDYSSISSVVLLVVMLLVMYLFVLRPQKKEQQKAEEMRNSLQIGDTVTTIGGVVGIVVGIKDDTILLETGSDRVKIRFVKSAVNSVEKLDMTSDVKTAAAANKVEDKKKKADDKKAEEAKPEEK